MRHLRLRRPDACAVCSRSLEPGTGAWWDTAARTVTCEDCHAAPTPPAIVPTEEPLDRGEAGASAAREHERRRDRREQRTREHRPRVGGLLLLLRDAPQHETAWQQGAAGERAVAESLEQRVSDGSVVLRAGNRRYASRGRARLDGPGRGRARANRQRTDGGARARLLRDAWLHSIAHFRTYEVEEYDGVLLGIRCGSAPYRGRPRLGQVWGVDVMDIN